MGRGLFVVLEGVEGAGKTTQARSLSEWFGRLGLPHVLVREPGGTPVGEAVRNLFLERGDWQIPPETELFLILAARGALVRQVIGPALARGEIVLADRFDLSTLAYQGFGRGLDLEEVSRANRLATGGVRPDLYLLLDLPPEEGLRRKGGGGDRMEREELEFFRRVRQGYLQLAEGSDSVVVIRGEGGVAQVQQALQRALSSRFAHVFVPGGPAGSSGPPLPEERS